MQTNTSIFINEELDKLRLEKKKIIWFALIALSRIVRSQNLFSYGKSNLGSPTEVLSEDNIVYLRPETCGEFIWNIKYIRLSTSKLPFGIAQIGKAFRNEIVPKTIYF